MTDKFKFFIKEIEYYTKYPTDDNFNDVQIALNQLRDDDEYAIGNVYYSLLIRVRNLEEKQSAKL